MEERVETEKIGYKQLGSCSMCFLGLFRGMTRRVLGRWNYLFCLFWGFLFGGSHNCRKLLGSDHQWKDKLHWIFSQNCRNSLCSFYIQLINTSQEYKILDAVDNSIAGCISQLWLEKYGVWSKKKNCFFSKILASQVT